MVRKSSGDVRLANRTLVLNLHALEPHLKGTAIGRRLGLNEATVRGILKRYGGQSTANGPPPTKAGAGRPEERSERWKRYVFVNFWHFLNGIGFCTQAPREAVQQESLYDTTSIGS